MFTSQPAELQSVTLTVSKTITYSTLQMYMYSTVMSHTFIEYICPIIHHGNNIQCSMYSTMYIHVYTFRWYSSPSLSATAQYVPHNDILCTHTCIHGNITIPGEREGETHTPGPLKLFVVTMTSELPAVESCVTTHTGLNEWLQQRPCWAWSTDTTQGPGQSPHCLP